VLTVGELLSLELDRDGLRLEVDVGTSKPEELTAAQPAGCSDENQRTMSSRNRIGEGEDLVDRRDLPLDGVLGAGAADGARVHRDDAVVDSCSGSPAAVGSTWPWCWRPAGHRAARRTKIGRQPGSAARLEQRTCGRHLVRSLAGLAAGQVVAVGRAAADRTVACHRDRRAKPLRHAVVGVGASA